MYILGVSCYYHDSAAVLLHNGHPVAAVEEERFSRVKHDLEFPKNAIAFCLEKAGITIHDVDYVAFYEKPLVKFDRFILSTLQAYPKSWRIFRESWSPYTKEKLWLKGDLRRRLGNIPESKMLFVEHHLSHAASAFFCSPYEEAAILTIDGVGEWPTATMGHGTAVWDNNTNGKGNSIDLFGEIRFPHSLGLFYTAFTTFLGFRANNGEYKMMGMAPYGRPTRVDDVYKCIEVKSDGSFHLNLDYFPFHFPTPRRTQYFSDNLCKLFGEPRVHDSTFYTPTTHPKKDHPDWDNATAERNQYYADIAASVQYVTEDTIMKMANTLYQRTGLKKLCMAGGVALNSVVNGRLLRESPFEEIYIQPSAGDAGCALGAALYIHHAILGHPRKYIMEHAYLGKDYTQAQVRSAIEATGRCFEYVEDPEKMAGMMVDDMLQSKVVALYQGRFEWGPRALGNRSILADPRAAEMKSIVNERIKFREPFRPFAPVVLEDRASDFFAGFDDASKHYPLRYMLMVQKAKEDKADQIQAVAHEGGTSRIQTIRREWNPLYYRAVELFGEATGVPVLLNTSFNLRGEPIVNTPENALNTFNKSDIDTLYIDGHVVRKK